MAQRLLELDEHGFEHTRQVLASYLPGLDPGLTPVAPQRALLAQTTVRALGLQYGAAATEPVLRKAGVLQHRAINDVDALDLLLQRDVAALPPRPAPAASARGWHLDAVRAPGAWAQLGGAQQIDWQGVRVGQIDTGYTRHAAFGFPAGPWLDAAAGRTFFAAGPGAGGAGPGAGLDPLEAQMDGHGTRVGSVIAGCDPTAPHGIYLGVAPKVPLVPVRIANHVLISHAQRELAQALDYLVGIGVSVINLSMGFLPRLQIGVLDRAI
ncbi:MAG TPA: S8 family serine peptidase, partial [Pseudorhodoferax sp.]|nr:S8 family serine peptidase [Pseudorhodoferax sp.]